MAVNASADAVELGELQQALAQHANQRAALQEALAVVEAGRAFQSSDRCYVHAGAGLFLARPQQEASEELRRMLAASEETIVALCQARQLNP